MKFWTKKDTSIASCIAVSALFTVLLTGLVYLMLQLRNYSITIAPSNRSDYIAIFSVHCSVVFLTTSLMAMLSENDKYIYWVEMVDVMLISPKYLSFLALVIYSISTVVWSMIGLYMGWATLLIGGFLFGLAAVTILFSRMIAIYYRQDHSKKQIQKILLDAAAQDEKKKEFYLSQLREITFIKAEKREFSDVYDNLALIETCILEEWKLRERKHQEVFQVQGYTESLYVDLLIDLSMKYTIEMQDYIEFHANQDATIRELGCLSYPAILNTFLENNRKDLFYRTLCKWVSIESQNAEAFSYMTQIAKTQEITLMGEYINRLFHPYIREVRLQDNELSYITWLQDLYRKNPDVFHALLEYKENREMMQQYFEENVYQDQAYRIILLLGTEHTFRSFAISELRQQIAFYQKATEEEKTNVQTGATLAPLLRAISENKSATDAEIFMDIMLNEVENIYSPIYIGTNEYNYFYRELLELALFNAKCRR